MGNNNDSLVTVFSDMFLHPTFKVHHGRLQLLAAKAVKPGRYSLALGTHRSLEL